MPRREFLIKEAAAQPASYKVHATGNSNSKPHERHRSPIRKARSEFVFLQLEQAAGRVFGNESLKFAPIDSELLEIVTTAGLTRAQINRALDDLVAENKIRLTLSADGIKAEWMAEGVEV